MILVAVLKLGLPKLGLLALGLLPLEVFPHAIHTSMPAIAGPFDRLL